MLLLRQRAFKGKGEWNQESVYREDKWREDHKELRGRELFQDDGRKRTVKLQDCYIKHCKAEFLSTRDATLFLATPSPGPIETIAVG